MCQFGLVLDCPRDVVAQVFGDHRRLSVGVQQLEFDLRRISECVVYLAASRNARQRGELLVGEYPCDGHGDSDGLHTFRMASRVGIHGHLDVVKVHVCVASEGQRRTQHACSEASQDEFAGGHTVGCFISLDAAVYRQGVATGANDEVVIVCACDLNFHGCEVSGALFFTMGNQVPA